MKRLGTFFAAGFLLLSSGCSEPGSHARGYYMLIDTSGTYTRELAKAQQIINFVLASLHPGDSFAVARIDTGSFSEKDIVARITFDARPSVTNQQKRAFQETIDSFVKSVKRGSPHTDVSGGLLQAVEYLNETGAGRKTVLIFSDLEEDLAKGYVRDFVIPVKGFDVIAVNVTKLRSDNFDPREYLDRLAGWRKRVESAGGQWRVINDLERLDPIIKG
ncbi:MAG: hypothetical protein Kow006_13060 [Gammaproteobacteria bacterium]